MHESLIEDTFNSNFDQLVKLHPILLDDEARLLLSKVRAGTQAASKLTAFETGRLKLDETERKRLRHDEEVGFAAQDELVLANQRLIMDNASMYWSKYGRMHSVSLVDLVSVGNVALLEAVKAFDATRNTKFSSFAYSKVKCAILGFLDTDGRMISLPSNAAQQVREINKAIKSSEEGGAPNVADIALKTGYSEELVADLLAVSAPSTSLDEPRFEGGKSIGDSIADDTHSIDGLLAYTGDVEEGGYEPILTLDERESLLEVLTPRERQAILLRYDVSNGIATDKGLSSFEQVGKVMGVSRQRVQQLQKKAWAKLVNRKDELGYAPRDCCA